FLAWLVCASLATTPFLIWEIEYFRHPGVQYYRIELALAALFLLSLPLYHHVRQRGFWRWELAALLCIPCIAGTICQPRAALATVCLALCAFSMGRALLSFCRMIPERPLDQIVVSVATGFGLLCPSLFLIGVAHAFFPGVFLALLILPPAAFWPHLTRLP